MIALDCSVILDGRRLPDGRPGDPATPSVLSGLSVTWGRATTVDQPAPSSCAFTVLNTDERTGIPPELRNGAVVEVTATGALWSDPDSNVIPPGIDTWHPNSNTLTEALGLPGTGARLRPIDGTRAMVVTIAPGPYSPTDPTAWDAIPRMVPGAPWALSVRVTRPPAAVVAIRPVTWSAPVDQVTVAGPWVELPAAGWANPEDWPATDELAASVTGTGQAVWLGLQVRVYPAGPAWRDAPGSWLDHAEAGRTWLDHATVTIDRARVLGPGGSTPVELRVFTGRVTDMAAGWDFGLGGVAVDVTAAGLSAELNNRDVGDAPWPAEPARDRLTRILTQAQTRDPLTVHLAATLADTVVSWRDVDRQPVAALIADLATTIGGVAWPATHTTTEGDQLRIEDPNTRVATATLALAEDGLVRVVPAGSSADLLPLTACAIDLEPVQLTQDVADVATRVAVSWKEQITDDEGKPGTVEHTETLIDEAAEERLGVRRVQVTTELTTAGDALDLAERMIARLRVDDWRIAGVRWPLADTPASVPVDTALALLDGTRRLGHPLRLTELPSWTPGGTWTAVFTEGGTYTHDAGGWTLDLALSSATGQGAAAVSWADLTDEAWRWIDFAPEVTWTALRGVAAPPEPERTAA